jgi:hypothetical protein
MNSLGRTLASIARTHNEFLPAYERGPVLKRDQAGPNAWDWCKDRPECFGPQEDFWYWPDNGIVYAVSQAALNWCYAKLPADIDRYKINGFKVGPQWTMFIVGRMRKDGLMSRSDYADACEENHNQSLQGES